jgi:uncharacterized protein YqjF (DUF2071 family)
MIAARILRAGGSHQLRPMFLADWREALFMHFRVTPEILRPIVPLQVDLYDGYAYVSLVAFTQDRLRPAIGGVAAEYISRPLARHEFLNLRTYVLHDRKPGIHFLSEWIPNRLAVFLGPRLYGLPYKLAQLAYHTTPGCATHQVIAAAGHFSCQATWEPHSAPAPCRPGSEAEFLLERYTAYTFRHGILRRFRIAHDPWQQIEAQVALSRRELLAGIPIAAPCSAHYCPGLRDVRIGFPDRIGPIKPH